MKSKKLYNVLEGFDFKLLNSPEFKEDSVREEIILPIIKGLGYSADKPNQIIRSRSLLHPFVSIGSQKKEIYIVPDYLLEINDKPAWILDAKSPKESLLKSKHVEQAYSYAIHSEVRVKFFALCNGIDFVLFNIEKIKPILHFPTKALPLYWDTLKGIVAPENVFELSNQQIKKDLGLHLKRLGFDSFKSLIFPEVPVTHICQMDPDFYSLSGAVKVDGDTYVVSFDFGEAVFKQLNGMIPKAGYDILCKRETGNRSLVKFAEEVFFINADCKIGGKLEENDNEIFLPMWVNRFISDAKILDIKEEMKIPSDIKD